MAERFNNLNMTSRSTTSNGSRGGLPPLSKTPTLPLSEVKKTPTTSGYGGPRASKSRNVTPSRNMDFKGTTEGDRYIPQHDRDQLDAALLKMNNAFSNTSLSDSSSPQKENEKMTVLNQGRAKTSTNLDDVEMMVWQRHGAPKIMGQQKQNVLYRCMAPSSSVKKAKRFYAKLPTQVLDVPNITNDFYINLFDWSATNVLAVAAGSVCYLWNASTAEASVLVNLNDDNSGQIITSVKYSNDGRFITLGSSSGFVHIFDVGKLRKVRKLGLGNSRVASIAWTNHGLLSYGNRNGMIQTHDVRERLSFKSEYEAHEAEVSGLKYVYGDRFLVSGGADGYVRVFGRDQFCVDGAEPLYCLDDHLACVKAIDEVQFMHGDVIATGGGTNDHSVKFWTLQNGELKFSIDTGNQVSGISFDRHYREMVTSHGFPQTMVKVWKHNAQNEPQFDLVHEVEQQCRILGMTKAPSGEFVAVIGDDDTLSIYDFFKKDDKYFSSGSPALRAKMKFSGVRQQIR